VSGVTLSRTIDLPARGWVFRGPNGGDAKEGVMPATTLHLRKPALLNSPELDATLERASKLLHIFRTVREIKAKRERLARELADTDQRLAEYEEPLRRALLDLPALSTAPCVPPESAR
jgi:hypothetical protein